MQKCIHREKMHSGSKFEYAPYLSAVVQVHVRVSEIETKKNRENAGPVKYSHF